MKAKLKLQESIEVEKIKFRHLSKPNQIAIVLAWIIGMLYCLLFLLGFFSVALTGW